MVLILSLASAALTAGFGVMIKELLTAPEGHQDQTGFCVAPQDSATPQKARASRRARRVRRSPVSVPSMGGLQSAHAR